MKLEIKVLGNKSKIEDTTISVETNGLLEDERKALVGFLNTMTNLLEKVTQKWGEEEEIIPTKRSRQ